MADQVPELEALPELEVPPSPADRTRRVVAWAAAAVLATMLASMLVAAASYRAVMASDSARENTNMVLADTRDQLADVRRQVGANNEQTLCRGRIAAALDLADRRADRVWRKAIADKVLRSAQIDATRAAADVEAADRLVDELGDLRLASDKVCTANPSFQPPDVPSR
jgi:hypothetical protein